MIKHLLISITYILVLNILCNYIGYSLLDLDSLISFTTCYIPYYLSIYRWLLLLPLSLRFLIIERNRPIHRFDMCAHCTLMYMISAFSKTFSFCWFIHSVSFVLFCFVSVFKANLSLCFHNRHKVNIIHNNHNGLLIDNLIVINVGGFYVYITLVS